MSHVKTIITVIDEEFVKVAGLVVALGDALSGSHLLQNGRVDWGVAAAAVVGLVNSHVSLQSWRAWLDKAGASEPSK